MISADLQERIKFPKYHLQFNWKSRMKGMSNILSSVREKLKRYKYIWIFSYFSLNFKKENCVYLLQITAPIAFYLSSNGNISNGP